NPINPSIRVSTKCSVHRKTNHLVKIVNRYRMPLGMQGSFFQTFRYCFNERFLSTFYLYFQNISRIVRINSAKIQTFTLHQNTSLYKQNYSTLAFPKRKNTLKIESVFQSY